MESSEKLLKEIEDDKAIFFMIKLFSYIIVFVLGTVYSQYVFYNDHRYEVIKNFDGMTCYYKEPVVRDYAKISK